MHGTASQLPLFSDRDHPPYSGSGKVPGFYVRESARARRLSIRVHPRGKVEVVVPRRTRPADVEAFVSENRRWIARALEAFAADIDPQSYALPSSIELPAIRRRYVVAYRRRDGCKTVRYRELGDTLVLTGRTDDAGKCTRALRRWLNKLTRRELEPLLRVLSAAYGLPFEKMQVRAQKTCWGSHSSNGTISLNMCLLFCRPEVVRYLLIHELCHGRHMDHSPAFWRLVGRCEPACRRLDRALGESWRLVPGWLGFY